MNKLIIHGILCIKTDAPEEIVRKTEAKERQAGMVAYLLSKVGFQVKELDRLWFSQSKKDSGGYWAMNIGGGRTWIDPVAVKNGIEYTHNAIKKPTKDAVLLLDEIGDEIGDEA